MNFWRNKKIVFGVLAVAVFMIIPKYTFAVAFVPLLLGGTALSGIVAYLAGIDFVNIVSTAAILLATNIFAYILGFIAGAVFTVGGFLVDFALKINLHLLESSVIKTGWEIVLSFTNLGFVLAIIIIAFATIFRMQSYAMKKTLWKLIVAALLVNFSLVIAGAFINIADTVTKTFNDKITGASGLGLSVKLAGVLNTQFLLSGGDYLGGIKTLEDFNRKKITGESVPAPAPASTSDNKPGGDNDPISMALKSLTTLLFIAFFTFLSALTFLAIAVMLIIRYIYLVILLILSPIVWLLWILPGTDKYWKEWWDNFLRWTFFAPIMLFFLYLTISTIDKFPGEIAKQAAMSEYANSSFAVDMAYIGDLIAILGLLMGGLLVANKMGITGAEVAMGVAQGARKWAQGAVGRKGLQLGTSPLRARLWKDEEGKRTKSLGEKAVEWSSKTGWLGRHTLGYAARGITRLETAGGENILKEHAKAAGNMSDADLKAANLTVSGPRKIAVTKELQKRKLLGDVDAKNLITEGNQSLFGRFRQGVSWGDVEHGAKMNTKIAKELRETGRASLESVQEFVKTYKGKDIEQSAIKDLYSGKAKLGLSRDDISELGLTFAEALATENYQMVPKIIPTMNARERNNFSGSYEHVLGSAGIDQRVRDAWTNTMNNYAMGFSAEAPAAGTPPPPPGP